MKCAVQRDNFKILVIVLCFALTSGRGAGKKYEKLTKVIEKLGKKNRIWGSFFQLKKRNKNSKLKRRAKKNISFINKNLWPGVNDR
jgi:hypothetical protein